MDDKVIKEIARVAARLYQELKDAQGALRGTRAFPSGRTDDQPFLMVQAAMPEIVRACSGGGCRVGYPSAD